MEGEKSSTGLYPEAPPPYSQDPNTNVGYPPGGAGYPPGGAGYPPGGAGYTPAGAGYQANAAGYPGAATPQGKGYPPPPPGQRVVMGQPTPGQVSNVTVVSVAQWGPYPMQIGCPHCGAQVMTETIASPGLLTWLLAGALIFFGCWIGCCLIPCCIPECQDIEHRCPNCKHHLGSYRRL